MEKKIPSPWLSFLRGVFLLDNHLASTDNLTRTTKRENIYQLKLTMQKVALMSNNTMKNHTKTKIDRAWFICLLQHPARKWNGSILTTLEHAWGLLDYYSYQYDSWHQYPLPGHIKHMTDFHCDEHTARLVALHVPEHLARLDYWSHNIR